MTYDESETWDTNLMNLAETFPEEEDRANIREIWQALGQITMRHRKTGADHDRIWRHLYDALAVLKQ